MNQNIYKKELKKNFKITGPEELVQAMFSLSLANTDRGPLQSYMAISELDSRRPAAHRLSPETVRLLAAKFEDFSDQYRIFSEFPELSDESIALFLNVVQALRIEERQHEHIDGQIPLLFQIVL